MGKRPLATLQRFFHADQTPSERRNEAIDQRRQRARVVLTHAVIGIDLGMPRTGDQCAQPFHVGRTKHRRMRTPQHQAGAAHLDAVPDRLLQHVLGLDDAGRVVAPFDGTVKQGAKRMLAVMRLHGVAPAV